MCENSLVHIIPMGPIASAQIFPVSFMVIPFTNPPQIHARIVKICRHPPVRVSNAREAILCRRHLDDAISISTVDDVKNVKCQKHPVVTSMTPYSQSEVTDITFHPMRYGRRKARYY